MSRRRTRFIWMLAAAGVLAGVFVSTAAALRFSDESYLTPEGVVGTPYAHTFGAPPPGSALGTGCDPPYIFSVDSGGLPPGLSLGSSSGVVSGTPTQAGSWSFWVSMKDDPSDKPWCNPASAERQFTIKILDRVTVGPETAPPGTVNAPYSLAMTATLSEPKTWSISVGTLPPGLTLGASDGLISGTPTTVGSYAFTVLAVVDPKRSDSKALTIVVRNPLAISPATAPLSEVGVSVLLRLSATGGSETYTWSLSSGTLPPGVSLGTTGTIAGRATAAGNYRFTVSVADTESRTASYNGVLNVAERVTIATERLRTGRVGRAFRAGLKAVGGHKPKKFRIKRGPLPRGIRFDPVLGVFSGTPTKAGTWRIIVEVIDALGVKSTKTLVIDVLP